VVSVPNGASKGARLEYLDNCWEYFMDMKTVYLATDNDEPGRLLRDELARRIGKERCKIVDFGIYKDANEVLQADPLLLPELIKQAKDYPLEGIFDLPSLEQAVLDITREGLQPGDSITIEAFNRLITWAPGYVTVITGIPNHGKGEFLDQIIIDLAHLHGWPFGIYSPENHPLALHVIKFASKALAASAKEITPQNLRLFCNEFRDRLFFIMPPEDLTLESILDHAAILVKKYGIRGLVIDPWNKLDHQFEGSETQYISRALDKLDVFARKYGVHVFLVAHPSKMFKDKNTGKVEVPTPYSISGSAHWYNKPANCLTVYRDFFEDGTSMTTVHVQKVKFKHWGGQGHVELMYNFLTGRYYTVGFENKKSYIGHDQLSIDSGVKPNVNFYEPVKEQEDETYQTFTDIPF
jgi:twinkle protein